MKGTYLIENPDREIRKPDGASGGPAGGPPPGGPAGGPPPGGSAGGSPPGGPAGGPPPGGPAGGPPPGGPAGGPPPGGPAGGPPPGGPAGGPPPGGPAGGPPPGGPAGGMPTGPLARELKLVWDGSSALWTNEVSEEVALDSVEETEDSLTFVAMAGPAPITWEIKKEGGGYTAISHRGADIHGNPPVDTVCKVTKID